MITLSVGSVIAIGLGCFALGMAVVNIGYTYVFLKQTKEREKNK